MDIKPLKKESLSEFVVAQMKTLIIKGELKKGDKIPGERELSERFEVSRASIREAMTVLSMQGLVNRTNAGTVVTSDFIKIIEETQTLKILLEETSYCDVTEARLILEKGMAELAAKHITKSELNLLKKHLDLMEYAAKAENMKDFVSADIAFHRQIAMASRNSVLFSLYNSIIFLLFKAQTQVAYEKGVMEESAKYHRNIYEALKNSDAELAGKEMYDHLIDIKKRFNYMVKFDKLREGA